MEERLVNKMDDVSSKLNIVQNKLASMDSNIAAAEARRRAALMQSSLKAVERSVNDKIDAVDRRLRQKQDSFEVIVVLCSKVSFLGPLLLLSVHWRL